MRNRLGTPAWHCHSPTFVRSKKRTGGVMKAPFLAIALALVGVLAGFSADAQTPNPSVPGSDENITPNRAEGDRVAAMGKVADDHKSVPARAVLVMTKADIAKKQEAERAEWKKRGVLGIITALKPETKEITISSRTMAGPQPLIIPVSEKVEMRRYAPDSIKFTDAKPANFAELKVGDQLRALGERSADGSAFNAEKVVTGSFKTVAGTITAVDSATGEVKI